MSAIQSDGPRLANVATGRNKHYYPISGLLDELNMEDKQERLQFTAFLKEYLSWDEEKRQGYTIKEHVALPDSCMPSYAKQFLDSAAIEPEVHTAEIQKSTAGQFYFPRRHLDVGSNFSPHPKKWSYAQHREGIIVIVGAIMVTQKRNLGERLRQQRVKSKKASHERRDSRRNRRAAVRQQGTLGDFDSDDESDSYSDFSSNARSSDTASPKPVRVQQSTSSSISRQSTVSSSTSTTTRQPAASHNTASTNTASPNTPSINTASTNITSPNTASTNTASTHSSAPTQTRPAENQPTVRAVQPTDNSDQGSGRSSSTPTGYPTTTPDTYRHDHHHMQARTIGPTFSDTLPQPNASEAETMRLISKIEGISYARKLCMEKHCEQQIAARSANGPAQAQLMVKSQGVLDMVIALDQALDEDQACLRRLVGA